MAAGSTYTYNEATVSVDTKGNKIPADANLEFDKTLISFTDVTSAACITYKWYKVIDFASSMFVPLPDSVEMPYFSTYESKYLVMSTGAPNLLTADHVTVNLMLKIENRFYSLQSASALLDVVIYH